MAGEDGILGVLDKYDLDALVMPTFTSFLLPAIAGLPVVSVPLGFFPSGTNVVWNAKGNLINVAPGIPFGIAFIGRKWSEEKLIALAYAFEQRTKVRQRMKPLFAPRHDLQDELVRPDSTREMILSVPSPEEVMMPPLEYRSDTSMFNPKVKQGWLHSITGLSMKYQHTAAFRI